MNSRCLRRATCWPGPELFGVVPLVLGILQEGSWISVTLRTLR